MKSFREWRMVRGLIDIKAGLPYPRVGKIKKILIATDYFFTHLSRNINPYEYFIAYRFYEKKRICRRQYYTNFEAHNCESDANGGTILDFKNKVTFNRIFADFIHRHWLFIPDATLDEFQSFVQSHGECIYKPLDGSMGRGVFKLTREQAVNQIDELYAELKNKKYLCEECVKNCREIRELNPGSLNTIRVTTVNMNGDVSIPYSFLRIGREGAAVDNAHSGGLFALINVENGMIYTPAYKYNGGGGGIDSP